MPHTVVQEYFRKYTAYFRLDRHICFNTEVIRVQRSDDFAATGQWEVRSESIYFAWTFFARLIVSFVSIKSAMHIAILWEVSSKNENKHARACPHARARAHTHAHTHTPCQDNNKKYQKWFFSLKITEDQACKMTYPIKIMKHNYQELENKNKKQIKNFLSEVGFEPTPGEPDCDLNAAPWTARPSWHGNFNHKRNISSL